jgi:hypothetical protein
MADKNNKKSAVSAPAKKRHILRNVLIVVLLIIIAGAVAFYYLYLSGGIASTALSIAQNPSQLNSILLQQFNQSKEITAGYRGEIEGNVTLPSGDPFIHAPINIAVSKYYNDTRAVISIQRAGYLGANLTNATFVVISKDNGKNLTVCNNELNASYVCRNNTGNSTLQTMLNLLYISKISGTNATSVYPTWVGQQCWMITGHTTLTSPTFAELILSSNITVPTYYHVCVSPSTYMPVSIEIAMQGSNGNEVFLLLNRTYITQSSSESNVTELP